MIKLTNLEQLEAELFVANANARADFIANDRVAAGTKAEVSRIKAEIKYLKEQDND